MIPIQGPIYFSHPKNSSPTNSVGMRESPLNEVSLY
jgi:hypothetical protein